MTRSSFSWHYCQQLFLHLRNCSRKTNLRPKQQTLLNSVQKCTFLIAALDMQHTSGIILPVLKLLQKKEFDIFAVIELIDSVLDILRQNRHNCENVFHKIFDQAKNECEKYDVPLLIPRRCKSQIFRDNYPSDDPERFFLRCFAKHCSRFRKVTGNISGRYWSQSSGFSWSAALGKWVEEGRC